VRPAAEQRAVPEIDAMRQDHKVSFRTRESIKSVAERARTLGKDADHSGFRVTNYFRMLATEQVLKTGLLKIQFFTPITGIAPAYVTYNPTALHVDPEIWEEADSGEPGARFIPS
jgi:hypothetical protein